MNTTDQGIEFEVAGATRRYLDAYRVAKALVGIGDTIKIVAVCGGGGLALLSLLVMFRIFGPLLGMVGLAMAVVLSSVVFLLGIVISAQGQILMAALDTAVHTSVFLTAEDKANAMSLQTTQNVTPVPPPLSR